MTQYEALNYDGTERRANYRFVSYRIDILHALGKREAAAIIFEILYRWETDVHCKRLLKDIEARKKAGLPPLTEEEVADQMWTYMSYNDFVRESGSALGYNTVIRMLTYLIEEKVIEQRENHGPRYPDYEYRINKEVVRKLLKALPVSPVFTAKVPKKKNSSTQMGIPSDSSTQMGIHAQESTQMGIGSTHPGTEVYPNGGTSQKDTENSQKERTSASTVESPTPDSLTHSSTPSVSESRDLKTHLSESSPYTTRVSPVDNSVDNQASSVEHHIANPTIENVESLTTRNTTAAYGNITAPSEPELPSKSTQRNTEPLSPPSLSPEGQRIDGYLKKLRFPFPRTKENFDYLIAIAEYIQSFEQMESYLNFTRGRFNGTAFLGNLANLTNMSMWLQKQAPPPEKPTPSQQGRPKSLAELNAEKMKYAGITARK